MNKLLFALLVAGPLSASAQAPVIEISGANFRPLPVAVPPPLAQDQVAKAASAELDQTLWFDLSASGIFQLLDRGSYLTDPKEGLTAGTIKFSRWADVGAESLVKVQLTGSGNALRGELRLYSVATGKEDLKVTESVPAQDVRRLAHLFADALFRHYTRELGPFTSRLSFGKKNGPAREVWISDWDGKNAQPISTEGLNLLPAVAPGGGAVAYTAYKRGRPELFLQQIGKPPFLLRGGKMATGVAFSQDGKRIAYSLSEGEGAQIWIAAADGSSARQITDTRHFINSSPSFSPDGKRVAFVSNRGGSPQIYMANVDGTGVRRLTFQGEYNQTPDWSPRGDLIAFTARDERNAFDLFSVNVESGKIARLTQDASNNEEPSFSPNGRMIVFTSTRLGGAPHLFVMTAEGNHQLPLPAPRGNYMTPDWGR